MIRFRILFLTLLIPTFTSSVLADESDRLTSADLWKAASSGDLQQTQACLDAGVPVDVANAYGVTALLLAADHGQVEVAMQLLEAGANPGTRDRFYSFTPLQWALNRKQFDLATALTKADAPDAATLLTAGVYSNNKEGIDAILAAETLGNDSIRWAAYRARILDRTEILDRLLQALPSDERGLNAHPPDPVDQYAGFYLGDNGETIQLRPESGSLFVKASSEATPQRLNHLAPNRFSRGLAELTFDRDQDETIIGCTRVVRKETVSFKRAPDQTGFPDESVSEAISLRTGPKSTPNDFDFEKAPWASFRGYLSRGIAYGTAAPIRWEIESGKNVAWKVAVDGLANSCPIVWDDRVFITTAVSENESASGFKTGPSGDVASVDETDEWSFQLLCLDLDSGEVIWNRECASAVPAVKRHLKSSHANPTPVTDGQHVIASFGSEGIFCYDLDGDLVWKRDLGLLDSGWFYDRTYQWGFASSPCLIADRVIVQCDIQDQSFLIALDLATGETIWRTERDEIPTWGSPVAYTAPDGTPTVVVSGTHRNAAYRLDDGRLLWRLGGFSEIVAPTPQVMPWGVLLSGGYPPVKPLAVVRHEARGILELPEPDQGKLAGPTDAFQWSRRQGGPYMSTPLVYEGLAYVCSTSGVLTCYDAVTGDQIYKKRIRGDGAVSFTGSPVLADGKIYLPSEQGVIKIIRAGETFELIGSPSIGEATLSTPAIANGYLILRGENNLIALRNESDEGDEASIQEKR